MDSERARRWKPGERAKKRQEIVLEQLRQGVTIREATAIAGVTDSAYYQWRRRDHTFAREVDRIRNRLSLGVRPVRPFDAAFRDDYFRFDTPEHLQTMMNAISTLEPGGILGIFVPPDHAKTTLMEDFICHQIAHDPNIRALLVSKSQKHAQKILGRVQRRMTDRALYEHFIDDYGPFRTEGRDGRPWTASHMTVARQDSGERDYTAEAVGITGHIYGTRTDLIPFDDIADLHNQTAAQIEEQREWIQLEALSRIGTEGRAIFVGTRIREHDIYQVLMDDSFFSKVVTLPAILREPGTNGPLDAGKSLWPERWPVDRLIRLRKERTDPRIWALSYQQDPLPLEGSPFPYQMLKDSFDASHGIGEVPQGCRVMVGIDPATTGFTAGVALAVNPKTKMRYVVDVRNERNLMGDGGDRLAGLVQFIVGLCETYKARVVCIETNNVQTLITSSLTLRRELARIGVRLMGHQSGRGENDDLAIMQLAGLFSNQMIVLPARGGSRGRMSEFINQFARWRPGDKKLTRDIVKAFQFAEKAARSEVESLSGGPGFPEDKLPPYLQRQRREVPIDEVAEDQ